MINKRDKYKGNRGIVKLKEGAKKKAAKPEAQEEKLWAGRFREPLAKSAERFGSSIDFDHRLWKQDIISSIAYAKALLRADILSLKECQKLVKTLEEIYKDIENNKVRFLHEHEDIHMNIEKLLTERAGEVGKKLHTGRSRNDLVATDLRMYVKDMIVDLVARIKNFQAVLVKLAEHNIKVIMPGYTHLQRAQPVLYAHYMMAYFEMFERDKKRMLECFSAADVLPLGSGAISGTNFQLNRELLAKELGFSAVSKNSMDAVSDRDFVIEFISAASMVMMHLSRMAEELVLWSSYEFGFIELPDAYSTGSSLMPQKKNPDMAELVRGKVGRVYGNLVRILTIMKALPLAYNRDMQEDKEALFDTIDTVENCLNIFTEMLAQVKLNTDVMKKAAGEGFQTATDLAYYLVIKGVPFREAHNIVGKVIAYCESSNMHLEYLSIPELKKFSDKFSFDAQKILGAENSVTAKNVTGGTSRDQVKKAITSAKRKLLSKA